MATSKNKPPSPQALERFIRLAAAAADTDTLIKLVAFHRERIDLCRHLVRNLSAASTGAPDVRSACRRAGTTPRHLRERLKPVVQALAGRHPKNHYERLSIHRDAAPDEIRRAYRQRAQALHPDHHPDGGVDSQAFIDLTAAYETLSDPQQRVRYDQMLAARSDETWGASAPALKMPAPPKVSRFPVGLVVLLPLLVMVAFALDFIHRHGGLAPPAIFPQASPPPRGVLETSDSRPERLPAEQSTRVLSADTTSPEPTQPQSFRSAELKESTANYGRQAPPPRLNNNIKAATTALRPNLKAAATPTPFPVEPTPLPVDLPRLRLIDFLNRYCQAYETGDLRRLAGFFHADAIENGQPFVEILPIYRSNMKRIDTLAYRIELDHYEQQQRSPESFIVKGRFFARAHVVNRGVRESHGTIDMTLVADGGSFLVKRLDYALTH